MTDWNTMVESIQAAMQAVDEAHKTQETLREKADRETLEQFRDKMFELCDKLRLMQQIMENEGTYSMDEIVEAVSHTLNADAPSYRRIPHYDVAQK